jgi:hypothetical protein
LKFHGYIGNLILNKYSIFFSGFSVDQFECTRECSVFDLFGISLYHGWVIDPQNNELKGIVNSNASSYNQLVEKMIRQKQSNQEDLARESEKFIYYLLHKNLNYYD